MITEFVQRHNQFLADILAEAYIPAPQIRACMDYALFPGGKRIRPLLVYFSGALLQAPLPVLDLIAAAIELTHCYSLIHDDLPAMDDDDFRRGKPSCHKAFDEATAILVGDGMQALAIELLMTRLPALLSAERIIKLTQHLVQASGISGMVSGQSLDLLELNRPDLTEEAVQGVHLLKTGKLIETCFTMVAASSSPSYEEEQALTAYAYHLGLVFQLQDDYLDRYAPIEGLGKNRSSDQANQKTTFASLFSQEILAEKIAQHFQRALLALSLFDDKADLLRSFTQQLAERTGDLAVPCQAL